MNYCELTATITAIAIAIAKDIPDNDELGMLSAMLTQLSDTLATIATHRSLCQSNDSEAQEVIPNI